MTDKIEPDYVGHRKRIKEKYKNNKFNGWLDYEILEFALSFAISRKDTKKIAKDLLEKYKTINNVLDASKEDLEKIEGISEHTAIFINFLKDISIHYMEGKLHNKNTVSSPDAVYNYLKASLKGLPDEEFKAIFMDNRNGVISIETIHTGTVNKSVVYPRKVVERALYHHAANVIVAHNHPAGSLSPSKDDCKTTKLISDALKTVDINLLDHIIIGGNDYFSFRENNLLTDER